MAAFSESPREKTRRVKKRFLVPFSAAMARLLPLCLYSFFFG